jgi:ubiquinone/menaquinone biosynthesis C-methylase UbiE
METNNLPPHAQLMQFILGKWISKPIYVVAELGIADLLVNGPESIETLAEKIEAHAPTLYRIMRALAGVGIFSEISNRCFELTPMAECLRTGVMRSIALMFHADWHDKAWDQLVYGVRTGKPPFEKAHGKPVFEWFNDHPEAAKIYNEANALKAVNSHRAIVDAYDFSIIKILTDVGGGYGSLMAEILIAFPALQGVVADLASVAEVAKTEIQTRGLDTRCRVVKCDFFREIPAGSDAYLMSHILHDWDDEHCRVILNNCQRAMEPGSKLLIVETIIPEGNAFSIGKLLDLEVFVTGGGRERTEAEFKGLLEACGFKLARIYPTQESISVIECIA